MNVETKTLDCPNDDCHRDEVSATLATFNAIGTSICPDCGEEL